MKKKLKMKIKLNQRKLWLLVCIMLILAVFSGCGEDKLKNSPIQEETLKTMEDSLRIFYDGTGYYLLKSFVDAHPEIDIMLINCIPNVDGAIDFDAIVAKYGVPDLIVAREEVSVYLSEWYAEGHIADLGEFCTYDLSINEDDYFPETFEVFRENNHMYALPLGIAMEVMLTAESKYDSSALAKLEEGYTGRELLNVLLEEVQKEKEAGEFFSETGISSLLFMQYLDAVTQTDDGIQLDEELFKLVYEFEYKKGKVSDEAEEFWMQQGKDFSSQSGYINQNAFDPRRYEGNFTASIWSIGDAPAQVLSYAETAYRYFSEEGIKGIYFPTADDGSKYQARVKLWGAVAEESNRKELAYELLRQLMDEDIDYFGAPWGMGNIPWGASVLNVNVYPVNIENAISLLDRFESTTAKLMYGSEGGENTIILDRVDVSEVEKEKHAEMLRSISGLFCWNKELQRIDGIFDDYYDSNIADYEYCYLDMLNALNDKVITSDIADIDDGESGEEDSKVIKNESGETEEVKQLKEIIRDAEVGETFFLGKTEQDNNLDNGAEPIEWIVLEKTANEAFVISRKVLEWLTFSQYDDTVKEYNEKGSVIAATGTSNNFTWDIERNQQRDWLTNELYENGFTESEKELILLTRHETPSEGYASFEDEFDDYIYIPSKEDVETYMPDHHLRQAEMTAYAAEKAGISEGEYVRWSLRTEAASSKSTMQINEKGEFGSWYCNAFNGVRPVMWLDIS